jgi:hypothetical protein
LPSQNTINRATSNLSSDQGKTTIRCLETFGLLDKKRVGEIANMLDICSHGAARQKAFAGKPGVRRCLAAPSDFRWTSMPGVM